MATQKLFLIYDIPNTFTLLQKNKPTYISTDFCALCIFIYLNALMIFLISNQGRIFWYGTETVESHQFPFCTLLSLNVLASSVTRWR